MSARRLTAVVPCVRPDTLSAKLRDLGRLAPVVDEVVVCFNGPDESMPAVAEITAAAELSRCILVRSRPYSKAEALLAGAASASNARILYTDDDCLLWGEPDLEGLVACVDTRHAVSFLVLRRPNVSARTVRAHLIRRRAHRAVIAAFGLLYMGVRGGGYVAGDVRGVLHPNAFQDDLLGSAEWAAKQGASIVVSSALVFQEGARPASDYRRKLPRLIYGSFQALRYSRSRRVRASILLLKIGKYFAVGLLPVVVLAGLWLAGGPLWLVLGFLPVASMIGLVWEGVVRGVFDRAPSW